MASSWYSSTDGSFPSTNYTRLWTLDFCVKNSENNCEVRTISITFLSRFSWIESNTHKVETFCCKLNLFYM